MDLLAINLGTNVIKKIYITERNQWSKIKNQETSIQTNKKKKKKKKKLNGSTTVCKSNRTPWPQTQRPGS